MMVANVNVIGNLKYTRTFPVQLHFPCTLARLVYDMRYPMGLSGFLGDVYLPHGDVYLAHPTTNGVPSLTLPSIMFP